MAACTCRVGSSGLRRWYRSPESAWNWSDAMCVCMASHVTDQLPSESVLRRPVRGAAQFATRRDLAESSVSEGIASVSDHTLFPGSGGVGLWKLFQRFT